MSVMGQLARTIVQEDFPEKDAFWDTWVGRKKYLFSDLNKIKTIPDQDAIMKRQITKIKEFQKNTIKNKFSQLNNTVSDNYNEVISNFDNEENKVINEAFNQIFSNFQKLNFYKTQMKKRELSIKQWENIQDQILNIVNSLSEIDTSLVREGSVQEDILNKFQARLNKLKFYDLKLFMKDLSQIKGDLLENMGVDFIQSLGISDITAIATGNVAVRKIHENGRATSEQMIEDILIYSTSNTDLMNTTMFSWTDTDGKPIYGSLSDLFKAIEQANGKTHKIQISEKEYDMLKSLQALGIQAKSGMTQTPWNVNLSTSVAIQEFNPYDTGLGLSVKRTFELITQLNSLEGINKKWNMDEQSEAYNSLANYGLATVMNKVLHLAENSNQYLLTPSGFETFPARIEYLMKSMHSIAHFVKSISIDQNTLSQIRSVNLFDKYKKI